MPLASGRILVASNVKPKEIGPEWTYKVDMQLIKQADRYVASNNEAFLQAMVYAYKTGRYDVTDLVAEIYGAV